MALADYRTALVTGASSGIGEAVVKALTARGIKVTAAARRKDRLDALAKETGCETLSLDVRDTKAIYDTLGATPFDILVNNAGSGRGMESLFTASPEDIDTTAETNVTAVLHMLRAVVPGMVARKTGHVVNIGSVAGLYPMNSTVYGASKGAVHLMGQNLKLEVKGSGVRVTEICPGRVMTEFFGKAFDSEDKARKFATGFELLQPTDIADAIVYALDAPWRVTVSTIEIVPNEQAVGGSTITPVERG